MNKGIILGAAAVGLLALVGVASAATKEDDDSPLPPPPTVRTPAQMAAQVKAHSLYNHWREAHGVCLYPPSPDPNDPNSYNVIAKLHNDACTSAQTWWVKMTTDLDIPQQYWDDVMGELE